MGGNRSGPSHSHSIGLSIEKLRYQLFVAAVLSVGCFLVFNFAQQSTGGRPALHVMAASVPYTANKKPKEWRRGLFIEWVNSIVTNPVIKKTPDEIEGLVRAFAVAKGYFSEGEADSIEISTRLIQAVAATKEKEPGQCLFRQSLSLESQGSLKKARLVTVRPFVANETYLKKNHQCIIDSRTAAAKMATTTFGSNPKSNAGSSKPIPTPIPTPMPKSNTEPTSKPTPLHTSSAPGLNHAPAEFSEAYKVALAEALAVQPHMSLRKFQLLHALC